MLTFESILEARTRISPYIKQTRLVSMDSLHTLFGCKVFLKAESEQITGAFKYRGALSKITQLSQEQRNAGLIAFSSGNHALATSYAARSFNAPCVVVMPSDAPKTKIEGCKANGAEVFLYNRHTESRDEICAAIQAERGLTFVSPYDDYDVMAGQGTIALEMLEQQSDLDVLVVCCGGAGLLAGVSVAAKKIRPSIKVYGVEPETCNDVFLSFQAGTRIETPVGQTIADGLQTTAPGKLSFPIIKALSDGILLVSDEEIIQTLAILSQELEIPLEPSGVAAAAAVLNRKIDVDGQKVGVVITGGNADAEKLQHLLSSRAVVIENRS